MISKEDILHLGRLSRIELTDDEVVKLQGEISSILDYVSAVNDIAGEADETKALGARYNVFREDEVTNEPDSQTKDLMAEMPDTDGRYLKVKKILSND